jgi:hypothetical protein
MSIKVTESGYFSKTTFISIVYVITMLILQSCRNQSIPDDVISTRATYNFKFPG